MISIDKKLLYVVLGVVGALTLIVIGVSISSIWW